MIAIVIDDYDSAISHYVNDLGFTLIEDTVLSPEKRWVVVAPSSQGARILLAKAANQAQVAAIGNSTGGRVGFFMYTTNFNETYEGYKSKGIEFIETPRQEAYGQVVVFKDKYGNKWDLIDIYYNEGISKSGDALRAGLLSGLIKQSGSYFTLEGEKIGQGTEAAKAYLKEHKDVMEKIKKVALEVAKAPAEAEEKE